MGNRLGRKKVGVAEEYTKPRVIHHQPCNVDYKKLRKLIRSGKLAPCFPGQDEESPDLEECPICFYYFPSLNRSRCCTKSICTECFLQMKPQDGTRPAQCPFCKSGGYAVKYHGARTQEEKSREIIEEQKVIEAKIRMQFQEQDLQHQTRTSEADSIMEVPVVREPADPSLMTFSTEDTQAVIFSALNSYSHLNREYGADPEEIMLMKAIWLSLQEHPLSVCASQSSGSCSNNDLGEFTQRPKGRRRTLTCGTQGQVAQDMPGPVEDACATATAGEHDKLQPETFPPDQEIFYETLKDPPKIEDDDVDPRNSSNSIGSSVVGSGILENNNCLEGAMSDESHSPDEGYITSCSHGSMSNLDSPSRLNCYGDHRCTGHDLAEHHELPSVLCNDPSTEMKTSNVAAACEASDYHGSQNYPSLVDESEASSSTLGQCVGGIDLINSCNH